VILPSALRRDRMIDSKHPGAEWVAPAGYVVAILEPGAVTPRHLANADVTDQDSAEREAQEWRQRGTGGRYVVCALVPVEQQRGET
jgi:hypothetical protein